MKINKMALLSAAILTASAAFAQKTKVIAHRGYWDVAGSAQNSLASLNKAHEINVYGSEFDVHLSKDGIAVISHDDSIGGMTIEESTYEQLKNITLPNGEHLPTLAEYLEQGKKNKGTRLILEIKPHKTKEAEDRAVATTLALVKKYKAASMTEYISFSMNICTELIRLAPKASVAYLRGEVNPEELKKAGFSGLDYHYKILEKHPDWIGSAKALGLSVNVWTVNDPAIMQSLIAQGVDFITTDKPVEATGLLGK
ncbi:MAG: glycerophosphodiester phosphodiesterase [Sphingobacteriales bacterium]|nr:MAG: glycerophosphodiester phosphodiesterase [Sphingobacteriales bacterium]